MAEPTDASPAHRKPRPWQIKDRRVVLDHAPFGMILHEDVLLPDGRLIKNFLRLELRAFVVVFAVAESVDGQVVPFIEQYRIGPRAASMELPAGFIEDGEAPLDAAKRELREEVGMEADQWRSLGRFFMDSSREAGWANIFLATGARQVRIPDHGDLGNQVIHLLPIEDARRLWRDGTMNAAAMALAVALALSALDTVLDDE